MSQQQNRFFIVYYPYEDRGQLAALDITNLPLDEGIEIAASRAKQALMLTRGRANQPSEHKGIYVEAQTPSSAVHEAFRVIRENQDPSPLFA